VFAGQTHLVTGGGSGIGRCTAHELAHLGATVVLVGRRADRLEAVRAEIDDAAAGVHLRGRSSRRGHRPRDRARRARRDRTDRRPRNNAGGSSRPAREHRQEGLGAVVANNLTGGFLCARECYTQWMAEHGGAIVNVVADMWGSMVGMGHSGAARGGMVSFTETAAVEWAAERRARERRRARRDRVVGLRHLPGLDAAPLASAQPPSRPRGSDRVRGLGGDLLPPVAAAAFISGSVLRVDGAAPNARLASPLSRLRDKDAPLPIPWPLDVHDRSVPFHAFTWASHPSLGTIQVRIVDSPRRCLW
jgi:citronellol/citronellal dehydrogenase